MIKLDYTITPDEAREALYKTGKLKYSRNRAIIQAVILLALAVFMAADTFYTKSISGTRIFIIAAVMVLIPVVVFYNRKVSGRIAARAADVGELSISVESGKIDVYRKENNYRWTIEQGSFTLLETERLFILELRDKRIFIIPKRAASEADTLKSELAGEEEPHEISGGEKGKSEEED